jgi:hypothetical protein
MMEAASNCTILHGATTQKTAICMFGASPLHELAKKLFLQFSINISSLNKNPLKCCTEKAIMIKVPFSLSL